MLSPNVSKVVLTKIDPHAEGSYQVVGSTGRSGSIHFEEATEERENVLPDSPERNLVVYHLLRMLRDLYINSKDGGKAGAYRKQCRTKRKSALTAILSQNEEALSFRWSCRALGYDPDVFRNRVLFDVRSVSSLMKDGVRISEEREKTVSRKAMTLAQAWLWEEAPARYHYLSEKKGHFIVKIAKDDADSWIASLENSPMEFSIESFDLTSGDVVLIVRHR